MKKIDISALQRPEKNEPIAPEDEVRFPFMANPFPIKGIHRGMDYVRYVSDRWYAQPPLPGPDDDHKSILGIPSMWYRLAIGCEACGVTSSRFVLPTMIAIWNEAKHVKNVRTIGVTEEFLEDYNLEQRSADLALKELHRRALIVYTKYKKASSPTSLWRFRRNEVMLLPTPLLDA